MAMRNPLPPALRPPETVPLSERLTWGYDDLARATGLSVPTLRKSVQTEGLPHCRIGERVLFLPSAVRDWFAGRIVTISAADPLPVDDDAAE